MTLNLCALPSRPLGLILGVMLSAAPMASADRSRAVALPFPSIADPDGTNALSQNAAALSALGGWELRLYSSQLDDLDGQGTSVTFGAPVWGGLSLGLGLDFLRPADQDSFGSVTLGAAWEVQHAFRIGVAGRFFWSDHDSALEDATSVDLSLLFRPTGWLSLGITAANLNTPDLGVGIVPRRYGLGLAVQPGTDRVSLEVGAEVHENNGDADVLARIRGAIVPGLELGVHATLHPRDAGLAYELGTSLAVHFGLGGIEGATTFNQPIDGDLGYDGFTIGARISGAAYPKIYERTGRTVVVELAALPETPSRGLLGGGRAAFTQILLHLYRIARDETVEGVILRDRGASPGWAQAEEIRESVDDLRAHGKDVTVYLDQGDTKQLFAYASANRIALNPAGGLVLLGLRSTATYLKDVLGKLKVTAQFVQFEEYKSFPEQFTRMGPSAPAQAARNQMLDTLWAAIVSAIDRGRGLPPGTAAALIDGGPYVAAEALDNKLVDGVLFYDELNDWIRQQTGRPVQIASPAFAQPSGREVWPIRPVIAIIPIEGSIVDGGSSGSPLLGTKNVGGDTIVRAVEAAVKDPRVVGIVVRVDSPGGSSLASDKMHRALQKASEKKPVIASFGDTAASGGYYLAMGAREVWAPDASVTGSIGIFTGKPVINGLLDWLGVGRDTLVRGKRADLFGIDQPWTEEELAVIGQKLEALYGIFLDRVATARKLDRTVVRESARGRVWLGIEARERKLVDGKGGVITAIGRATALAGVGEGDDIELAFYPEQSLVDQLRTSLGVEIETALAAVPGLGDALSDVWPFLSGFQAGEPLMLMPGRLRID